MGVVMNLPRFGALCIIACVLSVEAANANPAAEEMAAGTVSEEAQSRGNTSEEVTPGQLEEVIVTAQKRSERIQDVPMSITAASRDELSKEGVFSPADLEKVAPGFTYRQSQNGTPVYAIRGIGFYSEQAAVAPTVTVYQDQIPLPYARMTEGVPIDVERVEVLKGPQGTLFGQNSTAGAVNYVAAKPKDSFASGVDLTYGRFNEVDAGGYVTGPLTEG